MGKNNILKKFIKYVSLNVIGMIGLSFYILADTFFVSKALGSTGLAALNFSISLYSLIHGTGLMIGIGSATSYIFKRSKNNQKDANETFTIAVKIGILIGIIFLIIGQVFSREISFILGADSSTIDYSSTYLKVIFSFAPFFILNNILLAFVRNDSSPKLAMAGMLIGSFSNIILDYIFMFPLKGGMFGAALATGLAPVISIMVLSIHYFNKSNTFNFVKCKLKLKEIKNIFSLGLSSFINEVSSGIVLIIFNLVILKISGNIGVAAYGVVANLALIVVAIFTGIAQGIQPLTSRAYGKKDIFELNKILKYSIITSIGISTLVYLNTFIFSENLINIFNSENNIELLNIAIKGLRIYFIGFFFTGINIVSAAYFSAIEKYKKAFLISICRGFLIIIPMVILLSNILGMNGVWLSFVLTDFIVALISVTLLFKNKKFIDK